MKGWSVMGCDTLQAAAEDIGAARRHLELRGDAGISTARASLERAIALLAPASSDEDLPDDARDAAMRCRVVLSSHLLAADDFEAVGIERAAIVSLLYRATDSSELEAAILDVRASAPRTS
jgi:hypothetical protein